MCCQHACKRRSDIPARFQPGGNTSADLFTRAIVCLTTAQARVQRNVVCYTGELRRQVACTNYSIYRVPGACNHCDKRALSLPNIHPRDSRFPSGVLRHGMSILSDHRPPFIAHHVCAALCKLKAGPTQNPTSAKERSFRSRRFH